MKQPFLCRGFCSSLRLLPNRVSGPWGPGGQVPQPGRGSRDSARCGARKHPHSGHGGLAAWQPPFPTSWVGGQVLHPISGADLRDHGATSSGSGQASLAPVAVPALSQAQGKQENDSKPTAPPEQEATKHRSVCKTQDPIQSPGASQAPAPLGRGAGRCGQPSSPQRPHKVSGSGLLESVSDTTPSYPWNLLEEVCPSPPTTSPYLSS